MLFREIDMAPLIKTYRLNTLRVARVKEPATIIKKLMPRRCMVIATGLILAGLSIPALMTMQLLPVTLLLGFAGFALVATGGVMSIIFCGEI
jgi:hypothetical protein